MSPVAHEFTYPIFYCYLDLAGMDTVFAGRWLWSARRPAPAYFRRTDFLGDPAVPLDQAAGDRVEQATGRRPGGAIGMLAHLRFYFCFKPAGGGIEWIMAEINNTPWNERHSYVLDAKDGLRFQFAKEWTRNTSLGVHNGEFRGRSPSFRRDADAAGGGRDLLAGSQALDQRSAVSRSSKPSPGQEGEFRC